MKSFWKLLWLIAQNIHVTVDIDKYMLYFPFINGWEFDKGRTWTVNVVKKNFCNNNRPFRKIKDFFFQISSKWDYERQLLCLFQGRLNPWWWWRQKQWHLRKWWSLCWHYLHVRMFYLTFYWVAKHLCYGYWSLFWTQCLHNGNRIVSFFITSNDVTNMWDVDQASFQRLATIRWDMCNDDCIMEACLRICGKWGDS